VDAPIDRRGTMHGIVGWFGADLWGAATLTNAPGDPARIDRRNQVFLLSRPLDVAPGQVVRVEMLIRPHEHVVRWIVERWAGAAALSAGDAHGRLDRFEQSTFRAMLISADAVRRTRPSFTPTISERGRARRLVLELADGRTTVAEIEHAVLQQHPALFADAADAGRFVAEVVIRYAE
jgi:hypothetical protein